MQAVKEILKRSRTVMIGVAIGRVLRMGWSNRRGDPSCASGARHASKSLEDSLTYIDWVFDAYLSNGELDSNALSGARVLELGPGDNLGVALRFLASGARQVVGVDRFVTVRDDEQQRQIYTALLERLDDEAMVAIDDVVELRQTVRFNPYRLRVSRGSQSKRRLGSCKSRASTRSSPTPCSSTSTTSTPHSPRWMRRSGPGA